ncbi:MAG TPA: TetR/AcrR family transcriptional regulator [Propionibacteriaceae bacterium]|nr:TetR/AcrR family transcriptional regulator [Propionibacteriaceae bacterium]
MTTTTRGKRGPYAKTAETKATIGRASLEIVREKGHRALTTAEVSERAGVSEATRFYHFPTRDHLLVAAMEAAEADNEAYMGELMSTSQNGMESIPALLARRGMTNANELRLFAALAGEAPDPEHPAHDFMLRHNARAHAGYKKGVQARIAEGLAHPDLDVDSVARQMIAVWNGLQSQWLTDPSFDLADEIVQAWRRLTGQPAMEAKKALEQLLDQI